MGHIAAGRRQPLAGRGPRGGAACRALLLVWVSLALIATAPGVADARTLDTGGDPGTTEVPPSTLESDVHEFIVQKDGSVEEHDDATYRANTGSGVDDIAQRYVWFNKDIEQVQLTAAETIDPDGTAHPVGANGIRDVQEPRSAGAPTFEDGVLRTVIFPGVAPHSRVRLAFRKTRSVPLQSGTFSYFVQPTRGPVELQRLIFDLPADVPLHADARGYVALPPQTANGRTRYEFDYRHGPYAPPETGSVGYTSWGDRLMVTTTPDFATFAQRYRDAARDPGASDPAIVQLARSLTANTDDPREKARILYDWMRFNIRYVALFLGETAAVPHRAVDILRNRYGDCKDSVALYTALLAAVGIRGEAVLISLGNVYTLPSVPGYGADAINHVIVWMPQLALFADPTAGGTGFGYLPSIVMDRPALLVDEGALTRTPADQTRGRSARLQIHVEADGSASYAYDVEDSGATAETERNTFRRATRQQARQLAANRLRATGLHGNVALSTGELDETGDHFSTAMQGTLEHVVWPDGTTAIPALSSFAGGMATQVEAWLAEPRRAQPWICIGGDFDEVAQITLPARVRVTDLPVDTDVQQDALRYSSRYLFDPVLRTLQITRHLHAGFGTQVCSPQRYAELQPALTRIERDVGAQVVVREMAGSGAGLAR